MAELVKTGTPSLCSVIPVGGHNFTGVKAGEDIEAGDACRIHSDGKVYRSNGTSANANANVFGFAAQSRKASETTRAVTLYFDVRFQYSDDVVPGKAYYPSATVPGGLSDTATTGGTVPTAYGLPNGRIQCLQTILR